ncbi:MAG: hypothetical protein R3B95_17395 [Nitrospirales bacterium]|nr:hypothetical protein [Nitrospirales bacterium]
MFARKKKIASKKTAAKKAKQGGSNFYSRAIKKHATRTKNIISSKRKTTSDKDSFEKGIVFVAMSFAQPEMDDVFSAIKDTCRRLKLSPKRVDESVTSGFIILEVVNLIERAEFIIFDLTHERPNVYYELGYAHGVGNAPSNILLVAKQGTVLHFDIAALRVQFYDSTESLRIIVKNSLSLMLKEARA